MTHSLADSLDGIASQLARMAEGAAFVADGHVRVHDPEYLIGKITAAAAAIRSNDAARQNFRTMQNAANELRKRAETAEARVEYLTKAYVESDL